MRNKLFELRMCLWFFMHSIIKILFNKSQPDKKALAWHEKNKWFGKQKRKTKDALALHAVLVEAGISPREQKYYRLIDMFFNYKK